MTHLIRSGPSRLRRATVLLLGLTTLTAGCVDDDDPVSNVRAGTIATFDPSSGAIPIPNDLLFSGTLDGTLNIPIADPAALSDPAISLNTVDGASTLAPILMNFSRAIDPTSLVEGASVRLFEVSTFVDPVTAPIGGPVTGITAELTGADFAVSVLAEFGNQAIQIQPLAPLTPSRVNPLTGALENSVYMVVLTNEILDTDGIAVERDATYFLAAQTDPFTDPNTDPNLLLLQGAINAQLAAYAASTGDSPDDVVSSFTFTTQSIGSGLGSVIAIANGNEAAVIAATCAALGTCGGNTSVDPNSTPTLNVAPLAPTIGSVADLTGANTTSGNADIYAGSFQAPYYLTAAANGAFNTPTVDPAPVFATWQTRYAAPGEAAAIPDPADRDNNVSRFNPLPLATGVEIMPVLLSVPDPALVGPPPLAGWPVVIFAHGVYQSRINMLGIADAFADNGFAVICIDLPLHGVNPAAFGPSNLNGGDLLNGANIFVGFNDASGGPRERTFGMDQYDNSSGLPAPGQDGVADPSGQNFINLLSLAVTRDNLQQAVADFSNLRAALGSLSLPAPDGDVFDETQVHFVGHSLGAIIGMPFVTLDDANLVASTIAMGGGAVPYLLESSVSYGPLIQASLSAAGAAPGTPTYYQFLQTAQTLIDTTDAMNYAGLFRDAGTQPLFAMEVIGGGPLGGQPDLTVPNVGLNNPLAGTEPFIQELELDSVSTTTTDLTGLRAAVRYIEGSHSSPLTVDAFGSPAASNAAAFPEMQGAITGFHLSNGTTVTVTDPNLVQ
ncbi:MAG: alpha/beta fold hydrolase [Planctomycetota bacterium]|nr:alpha/beta fold hydrolase [Planctomycetota bacterium]MDG1984553.1 alpha/beta fold hydrolase [Planctomycetota bacterium]